MPCSCVSLVLLKAGGSCFTLCVKLGVYLYVGHIAVFVLIQHNALTSHLVAHTSPSASAITFMFCNTLRRKEGKRAVASCAEATDSVVLVGLDIES